MGTPRDFLQYRRARVQEDGSILMMLRSAEHPDMPENKNYVRAESHIAGYVLRQTFEAGQPVLNIFLMSCADIKGLVPKWVINYVAPRKPPEWVDSLQKACMEYQKKNPDYEKKLQEYVERYQGEVPFDYEVDEGQQSLSHPNSPTNAGKKALRADEVDLEAAPIGRFGATLAL